ncbi:MAG: hypothetical protein ACD_11C00103G0029 [uncultured bacterium]|nr:MAG: hypothetical protein ACD_11C00103G0029 [uncultured bacterium]
MRLRITTSHQKSPLKLLTNKRAKCPDNMGNRVEPSNIIIVRPRYEFHSPILFWLYFFAQIVNF